MSKKEASWTIIRVVVMVLGFGGALMSLLFCGVGLLFMDSPTATVEGTILAVVSWFWWSYVLLPISIWFIMKAVRKKPNA